MGPLIPDWLAPEGALVDRLKDQVAELKGNVFTASDPVSVIEAKTTQASLPLAAHVIFVGDVPVGPAVGQGQAQTFDQHWMVGLKISNYRDPRVGATARKQAGALLPKILSAINGWDPRIAGFRPFVRGGQPTPPHYADDGSAFFPMIFTTRVFT
jgi:hypothetical protein